MSNYIPGNQKHFHLDDRIYIENSLNKGYSFKVIAKYLCKNPTQWDVNMIVNHINSTPRNSLDVKTPYDSALESFGENTVKALQLKRVSPDEVNLTPKLSRFNHELTYKNLLSDWK